MGRRRRTRIGVLVAVGALGLSTGASLGCSPPPPPTPPAGRPVPTGPVAEPTATPDPAGSPLPPQTYAGLRRALDRHAAAIMAGRKPRQGDVRGTARRATGLVTTWRYRLGAAEPLGATRVRAQTELRYRFSGEPAPVRVPVTVEFARAGQRWQVVAEQSAGERRLPWELGPVAVVRTSRSTLVGVGAVSEAALQEWADRADRAVRAVRELIVDGWRAHVTVVVPARAEDLVALTGRSARSWSGLAGLAMAESESTPDRPTAYRVFLNPALLDPADGRARDIVLRHEITHVATGAPATARTPLWLEEGLAQYVGYRGSGVPLTVATRDIARLPRQLPPDRAFQGAHAARAYALAHLACVAIAAQVGPDGLLAVYRRTADTGDFAAAWRQVAGSTVGELLRRWRALGFAVAGRG